MVMMNKVFKLLCLCTHTTINRALRIELPPISPPFSLFCALNPALRIPCYSLLTIYTNAQTRNFSVMFSGGQLGSPTYLFRLLFHNRLCGPGEATAWQSTSTNKIVNMICLLWIRICMDVWI